MNLETRLAEAFNLPVEAPEERCNKLQYVQDFTLAHRLEAHREHPGQVISREVLEAKWRTQWGWKSPS